MLTTKVYLPTGERVQAFVETLTSLDGEFELLSDGYILDARSLMGIFSLDLSKPIDLKIYNDSQKNLEALRPFTATGQEEVST